MGSPYKFHRSIRIVLAIAGLIFISGAGTSAPVSQGSELINPPEWQPGTPLVFTQGTATLPGYVGPNGQIGPVTVGTRMFKTLSNLLVGPTIRMSPGKSYGIPLTNNLNYSDSQGDDPGGHPSMSDSPFTDTLPHGFDVVNLHTHGLHVSPNGHSDNVLLNLFPANSPNGTVETCKKQISADPVTKNECAKGNWPMAIQMPSQHASGTYWYHTHKHGAVALHLASGLAGAIIVQDSAHGLESLAPVQAAIANGEEKVMVIQNIAFATTVGVVIPNPPVSCQMVYGGACTYPTPTTTAGATGNPQLSVNGQFNPTVTVQTGEAQLWRMINTTPGTVLPVCLSQVQQQTGRAIPTPALYVLAADGVPVKIPGSSSPTPFPLGAPVQNVSANANGIVNNELMFLAPGQRLDLMVQPSAQGLFVLQTAGTATTTMGQLCPSTVLASSLNTSNNANVVAFVNVVAPGTHKINTAVPTQAQINALYTQTSVVGTTDEPKAPTQGVTFGFTNRSFTHVAHTGTNAGQSIIGGAAVVNGRPFYEGRVQRTLTLNEADRWSVQSAVDTHMFHIHTNSFQIVRRGDTPYPFPIWRDTALINCAAVAIPGGCSFQPGLTQNELVDSKTNQSGYGEVLQFVSRAVDYTGVMVMHCHNTNHEDNGMMELVQIKQNKK